MTFWEYKNKSFPSTIPHCINKEQTPVTCGVAILVPVSAPVDPPGKYETISSPGANKSGLIIPPSTSPSPENVETTSVLELKLPTVITLLAVPGTVTVRTLLGSKNLVSTVIPSDVGKYISIFPSTNLIGVNNSVHIPGIISVSDFSSIVILLLNEYGAIG